MPTPDNLRQQVTLQVPATTANLGPGFDCLGLALNLRNQVTLKVSEHGLRVDVSGLGAGFLPTGDQNLVARAARELYRWVGAPLPPRLHIHCQNNIPLGSGLGSSAAAVLAGLLGANYLLGQPATSMEILRLATEFEGHPDNVAAALMGGLVMVSRADQEILLRQVELCPASLEWSVIVAVPRFDLPTRLARAALPETVPFRDAVKNLTQTAFVIEALRSGDLSLLGKAMQDCLHQPYRFPLIPGIEAVFAAARQAGAPAVALSGAGPSVVAFTVENQAAIAAVMAAAFSAAGLQAESLVLSIAGRGAGLTPESL